MNSGTNSREEQSRRDAGLLGRIAQKDQAALSELYDHRGRLIYSLVLRMVGSSTDAEEVTQETFLKIWQNAATFDTAKGSPITWIITIARRLAIDRTRSKSYKSAQRTSTLDEAISDNLEQVAGDDPADRIVDQLQAGEVRNLLGQLSENHLKVIYLSYYECFSHSEIADRLEIPLGTVKSRMREGVNHLRKLMEQQN